MRALVWVAWSSAIALPRSSLAQITDDTPIVVDFAYDAPAICPNEEHAFSLVHRRSERVVRGTMDEAAQHLRMAIIARGGTYKGELTVLRDGQSEEKRAMAGNNCEEVVEALALTAALSIDPNATLTLGPIGGEGRGPSGELTSGNSSQEVPRADETSSSGAKPRSTLENDTYRVSLGPTFMAARIMEKNAHVGGGASFSVRRGTGTRWFPLELTVAAVALFEVGSREEPRVSTRIFFGSVSYCPLRLGASFALLLCPNAKIGAMTGRSRGVEDASVITRLYASAGGQAHLRWQASERLDLSILPSIDVPLTRRRFGIDPGPQILASTLDVGWSVSWGAGWVF